MDIMLLLGHLNVLRVAESSSTADPPIAFELRPHIWTIKRAARFGERDLRANEIVSQVNANNDFEPQVLEIGHLSKNFKRLTPQQINIVVQRRTWGCRYLICSRAKSKALYRTVFKSMPEIVAASMRV